MERPTNWRDIRSAALDCKQLFQICLKQIKEPRTASLLGESARISYRRATDQMHRVHTWLSEMDAEAEESLSLDHCLSNNKSVRDEVINRLRQLFHSLQYVIQIAQIRDDENRDVRETYNPDNLATDLLNAQRSLEKNIAELYKLGETIQKPPSITDLLKTVRALLAKQQVEYGVDGIADDVLQHLYPAAPFNLQLLLADFLTRQYYNIQDRGERQRATRRLLDSENGQMEVRDNGPELRESITRKDQDDDAPTSTTDGFTTQTWGSKPPTLQVDEFRRRLGAEWKHVALSTTSSVAIGDISYPQQPRPVGTGESSQATCHYCYKSYPYSKFQDTAWWRRHVDHDLQPYVCLDHKCLGDQKSFGEFKSWFEHMEKHHSSNWIATINSELTPRCDIEHEQPEVFEDESFSLYNMREHHPESFETPEIVQKARQENVCVLGSEDVCPLCGVHSSKLFQVVDQPNYLRHSWQTQGKRNLEYGEQTRLTLRVQTNHRRNLSEGEEEMGAHESCSPVEAHHSASSMASSLVNSPVSSTGSSTGSSAESNEPIPRQIIDRSGRELLARHIAAHLKALSFICLCLNDSAEQ